MLSKVVKIYHQKVPSARVDELLDEAQTMMET
jgi:hypothetical protein